MVMSNKPIFKAPEVERLLKKLDFSPEGVVDAAAEQPRLFIQAGEYRIAMFRRKLEASARYDLERSKHSLSIREESRESGEKITEAGITDRLNTNPQVITASKDLTDAEEGEEAGRLLLEAFRVRRDCLRIVAELVGSELSLQKALSMGTTKLEGVRKKLRNRWPEGA